LIQDIKIKLKTKLFVFFLIFLALFTVAQMIADEYYDCVDQGNCKGSCWCKGTLVKDGTCYFHCEEGMWFNPQKEGMPQLQGMFRALSDILSPGRFRFDRILLPTVEVNRGCQNIPYVVNIRLHPY